MPPRLPPITDPVAAIEAVNRRLDSIEDSLTDRLLPPGYVVNVVAGNVVITRQVDAATSTLVFA